MTRRQIAALVLLVLGVLYAIPIVVADRPYIDDLRRSLFGYSEWGMAGRPVADLLMEVLNLGMPLTDLSPLPQIIGIAIVVYTSWRLFVAIDVPEVAAPALAAGSALLLYNPFFLENMAYKFDAAPMALAVCLAVLAALPSPWRGIVNVGVGAVLVFLSLALYQPAANLIPPIVLLVVAVTAYRGTSSREVLQVLGVSILRLALGCAAYILLIPPFTVWSPFALEHSPLVPADASGLQALVDHSVRGMSYLLASFSSPQLFIMFVAAGMATAVVVVLAVRAARRDGIAGVVLAAVLLLSPAVAVLSAFGTSAVLLSPVFAPRVFIGFGGTMVFNVILALVAMTAVYRLVGSTAHAWLSSAAAAVPIVLCLGMAYAFGVAEKSQKEFDTIVSQEIGSALFVHGFPQGTKLAVDGVMPRAPLALRQSQKYPLIGDLVPLYLNNDWYWGGLLLRYHGVEVNFLQASERQELVAAAAGHSPFYTSPSILLTDVNGAAVLQFR